MHMHKKYTLRFVASLFVLLSELRPEVRDTP
jgi:hypothetical protein